MMSASARSALLGLACGSWMLLAACAGPQGAAGPGVVVVRDDSRTVWMTKEAEDAAKAAAAEADARRAAARAAAAPASAPAARPQTVAPVPLPGSAAPELAAVELPADRTTLFDFDRYEVKQAYWPMIEALARWLQADRNRRVAVEGHADERGGSEYNLALGQRRAEAVRQMLAVLGVAPEQAEAVSFGDTRPIDRSHTEEAFARNRRVEIRPL